MKTAVLLVNLGSPSAPDTRSVRRYLREFLSDKRVVRIPSIIWWPLLNFVVLPFRPKKTAAAYQKIWTDEGSPLVAITRELAEILATNNAAGYHVDYAMRYGKPSITEKLNHLKKQGIENYIILPLYPQYSQTTTSSVFDAVINEFNSWPVIPEFRFISDYHQDPAYIDAISQSIGKFWETNGKAEQLIMSFHGLPENSKKLGDPYFDQCHRSAKLIAKNLELPEQGWQLVFQSRFGRAEWLKPYCVEVLQKLPGQGIKNIDVVCPGFSIDCLETLEEIAITNKQAFINAGGKEYRYIPALNGTNAHAQSLHKIIRKT
jgi:ferrochelatase